MYQAFFPLQRAHSLASSWNCLPSNAMTGQHCENCDVRRETVHCHPQNVYHCCTWSEPTAESGLMLWLECQRVFHESTPASLLCLRGYYSTLKGSLYVEWTMMNNEPWIKLETLGNEWRNMSTWIDESSTSILKYYLARHFVELLFNTKILQNILFMKRWLQTDTILSKNRGDQNTRNLQSLVTTSIDFIMLPVIHFYKRLSRDALFSVQID